MKVKHTPGPWGWVKDTAGYHLCTGHSGQLVVLTSSLNNSRGDWDAPGDSCIFGRTDGPAVLCEMTPDHPDARLIAAGPCLLAACESLVSLDLGILIPMRPKEMTSQEWRHFQIAIDKITAAVAKARGTDDGEGRVEQ